MPTNTRAQCKPACHAQVPKMVRGKMVSRNCQKPVILIRQGYLWCRSHDPERDLAAEREKRAAKTYRGWQKRWLS